MKFKAGVLTTKILGITLLSIFICTLFIGWLIYGVNKLYLEKSLRQSLERLAVTSSLMIDGELHKKINSTESPEYRAIQSTLIRIKKANQLAAPIYTLRRPLEKNKIECVVTTDPVYLLGARYNLKKEMAEAFGKGVATSTRFYKDKTGTWISAYAPIKDKNNHVVALLKVQYHAGYIFEELRSRLWIVSFFCAMGFIISSLITIPMIRPITESVKKLDDAAHVLESGNYEHEITIRSNDEVGHLAKTFNEMRKKLKTNTDRLREAWIKEKKAHLESILTLSRAIEIRDPYTKGHVEKVSAYASLLSKKLGLSASEIENLKYGCMLHDLGKLDININLLSKGSKLSKEERDEIKLHTKYGAEIIRGIDFLETAREIILYHHERYDGTGYPYGLKGKKIPLMARIVSLIDAFDAMTSDRPYRKSLGTEKAFSTIAEQSGKQFDPELCTLFLKLKPDILKIRKNFI